MRCLLYVNVNNLMTKWAFGCPFAATGCSESSGMILNNLQLVYLTQYLV